RARRRLDYSNVLFGVAVVIWLTNLLSSCVRGSGNMLLPSLTLLATATVHVALCPLLVFGWGPVKGMGIGGAAASMLTANALAGTILAAHLLRPGGVVQLRF